MIVTVRAGTPAERNALHRIRVAALRAHDVERTAFPRDIPDASPTSTLVDQEHVRVVVAEESDDLLGWALAWFDANPLTVVFLDPETAGVETRTALLAWLDAFAQEAGIDPFNVFIY